MKRPKIVLLPALLLVGATAVADGPPDPRELATRADKAPLSEQISMMDMLRALEKSRLEYLKTKKESLALEREIAQMTRPAPVPKPQKPAKKQVDSTQLLKERARFQSPPSAIGHLSLEGVSRTGGVYEARLRNGGQLLYLKVGDQFAGWKLKKITATDVVFEGPNGKQHRIGYRDRSKGVPGQITAPLDAAGLEALLQ